MRPRNTLTPDRFTPAPRKTSYSNERPSLSGTASANSHIKNSNQAIDALAECIFNSQKIIGRFHNPESTLLPKNIKNDQKTVVGLMGNFLGSIDQQEQVKIEVDHIPELFRMLRYPTAVSKNIFNPVGAKHTWGQCLTLISWLGQISSYAKKTEEKLATKHDFDWEQEKFYIDGFRNKQKVEKQALTNFFEEKLTKMEETGALITSEQNEIEAAINTIKAGQKDIEEVEEELKRAIQAENKEMIDLGVIENQIKTIRMQIHMQDLAVKDARLKFEESKMDTKKIERQVSNQSLTVKQAEKMAEEVHQLELKKKQLEAQMLRIREEFEQNFSNQILKFQKQEEIFHAKFDDLKKSNQGSLSPHVNIEVFEEFPINYQLLQRYYSPQIPSNDHLLSQVFVYSHQEKTLEIQKAAAELQAEQKSLIQKEEECRAESQSISKMNEETVSRNNKVLAELFERENAIRVLQEATKNLNNQLASTEAENIQLSLVSEERTKTFSEMMVKVEDKQRDNDRLVEKVNQEIVEGDKEYLSAVQRARSVVNRVNGQFQRLHRKYEESNSEYSRICEEYQRSVKMEEESQLGLY